MSIKLVDLAEQNREVWTRVEHELRSINRTTVYIGGIQVAQFEREFAEFLGMGAVIGVGSGTDALRLALLALGIGPGDEVITVPFTFIGTVEAIVQTGARPVFVDVDWTTCNMDVAAAREYLAAGKTSTPNGPRAILAVDLYGLPAPTPELRTLADQFGLKLVEDACQAHGARIWDGARWVRAGACADAACFSFYPSKNLGAWGEAGAVATNDQEVSARVSRLRDHGRISHYTHVECGYNARLDAVQAAVLRAKLERLEQWNARRREIAKLYDKLLGGLDLELPREPSTAESCYHLFVIRSPKRDQIQAELSRREIESGIHYPMPLHLQPACRFLGYSRGEFPVSERLADMVLSVPIHPQLSEDEVAQIVQAIRSALVLDKG